MPRFLERNAFKMWFIQFFAIVNRVSRKYFFFPDDYRHYCASGLPFRILFLLYKQLDVDIFNNWPRNIAWKFLLAKNDPILACQLLIFPLLLKNKLSNSIFLLLGFLGGLIDMNIQIPEISFLEQTT